MAESEAIWQHAGPNSFDERVKGSLDWQWKERYYVSSLFFDLLSGDNLGFTDAELKSFYRKDPAAFRVTLRDAEGGDSSFVPSFDAAKRQVADMLFYDRFKPDSAFLASVADHDHDHDDTMIRNHWLYHVRTNPPQFYMRHFFKERTGQVYNDDLNQIYGEGGIITPADMEIIRVWAPEHRRSMRTRELAEWLYKWKVFSEHTIAMGLAAGPEYEEMMHWVRRVEHAAAFLRAEVVPALTSTAPSSSDTALAILAIHDQNGRIDRDMPAFRIESDLDNLVRARINAGVDGAIHGIRGSVGIRWLDEELADKRCADPVTLAASADSLKEVALSPDVSPEAADAALEEAEGILRTLSDNFAFLPQGRRAMGEVAKMLIDRFNVDPRQRHLISQAIGFYRRLQAFETDPESICNSHFMVGYTYDEHVRNFALAEANYKWILRFAPTCALASDAEFMLLHLDEPMTSIEEIRGRSLRQGRRIDFDEESVGGV
jgi:hypothetical protein